MKRFFLLLQLGFCFLFSFGQTLTKSAFTISQSGSNIWMANSGINAALQAGDNLYVHADIGSGQNSGVLNLTGFNFNLPTSAIINGITVSIKRHAEHSSQISDKTIRLLTGGNLSGENKAVAGSWSMTDGLARYGAGNDTWMMSSLTAPQVNASNFGIAIQVQNGGTAGTALIDYVSIAISYTTMQTRVRFVSLTSKKEISGIRLTWEVHEEDRLLRYEIERSENGLLFEKIGVVPAKAQEEYSFIDHYPVAGTCFYRIKAVDMEDKYGYSTVLCLGAGNSGIVFKAFPTIVQNQLTVQHDPSAAETYIIISNQAGKTVRVITPLKGSMETSLDLSALSNGLYILKYNNPDGTTESIRFIKQ